MQKVFLFFILLLSISFAVASEVTPEHSIHILKPLAQAPMTGDEASEHKEVDQNLQQAFMKRWQERFPDLPGQTESKAIISYTSVLTMESLQNAAQTLQAYDVLSQQLKRLPADQRLAILHEARQMDLFPEARAVRNYLQARTYQELYPHDVAVNCRVFHIISRDKQAPTFIREKAENEMFHIWCYTMKTANISLLNLGKTDMVHFVWRILSSSQADQVTCLDYARTYRELYKWELLTPSNISEQVKLCETIISLTPPQETAWIREVYYQASLYMRCKPQDFNFNHDRLRGIQNSRMLSCLEKKQLEVWLADLDDKWCQSPLLGCIYGIFCCIYCII